MIQCRICFGQEDEHLMICPCECRGTSAYIHLSCLEEYFYHYPDRNCRVCHQYMHYTTPFDKTMFTLLLGWLSILVLVSNTSSYLKLFFLGLLMATALVRYLRNVMNIYVSIFIIICTFIVATTSHRHLTNTILFIGGMVTAITVSLYIPLRYIILFLLHILLACYCIALVIFFAEQNDVYMTSCFMSVLLFVWALLIQTHPPARYL